MTDVPREPVTVPIVRTERVAGLLGKTHVEHAPELWLESHRSQTRLETLPASVDNTLGLDEWLMLANGPDPDLPPGVQPQGDCGYALMEHARMVAGLVSVATDNATFEPGFILPSTPRTLDEYWAYGIAQGEPPPEPDEGVSNYSMLLYQFQQTQEAIANGNDDITEWAFGEIGTDITSLKSEVVEFKVVLLGVDLTNNDQMEFGNDQPWGTDLPVQPNPALGHDVGLCAYDDGSQMTKVLSWAKPQEATYQWVQACATDAWVIVTEEDVDSATYQSLLAACKTLANSQVNPNAPNPTPTPPTPAPPAPVPPGPVDYQQDSANCRAQLAKALSVIQAQRRALNAAHANPEINQVTKSALQTMDAPLLAEDNELIAFLAAPLPTT